MNKELADKYTFAGDGYETRVYYYPQDIRTNNYWPVLVANTKSVKELTVVYGERISIDTGDYSDNGYIYSMGDVHEDIDDILDYLINTENRIREVFYE